MELTKSYFDSALSRHVGILKSHFDASLISELNEKVISLTGLVTDLRRSLEFTQQDIVEIKEQVADQKVELRSNSEVIANLQSELMKFQRKVTYLENQSRRNNLYE